MAPDLGQGGGQAIEDAVTLAAALAAGSSVPSALTRYDELRRRRTQRVVRLAHRIGAAAHLRNRLAVARDAVLATVPPTAGARLLDPILDWTPPPPPVPKAPDNGPRIRTARRCGDARNGDRGRR